MEHNANPDHSLMIEENFSQCMQIDPRRARFQRCIVWTPLPIISWFIPFIGHLGICREDGVILDFAGPNFVSVDNFAFGAVARYLQIGKEECCLITHTQGSKSEDLCRQDESENGIFTWDDALRKSTQEFQHQGYSLFTCNCHSFVANSLNKLGFCSGGWNVVNLAAFVFFKGQWVNRASFARSVLPFIVLLVLGLAIWGWTYLTFLACFTFILLGWFLLGTYCFPSLIQL